MLQLIAIIPYLYMLSYLRCETTKETWAFKVNELGRQGRTVLVSTLCLRAKSQNF